MESLTTLSPYGMFWCGQVGLPAVRSEAILLHRNRSSHRGARERAAPFAVPSRCCTVRRNTVSNNRKRVRFRCS
jgi:hypothetical protein